MVAYAALSQQATTGPGGYALVNGTGTIISWQVPNDGRIHPVTISGTVVVGALETGGQLAISWTRPDGTTFLSNYLSSAQAAGTYTPGFSAMVKAGTTVSVTQNTALTGGGPSTAWVEIMGG